MCAKKLFELRLLKKCSSRESKILHDFPDIGETIETYVQSCNVGADQKRNRRGRRIEGVVPNGMARNQNRSTTESTAILELQKNSDSRKRGSLQRRAGYRANVMPTHVLERLHSSHLRDVCTRAWIWIGCG